MSIETDLWDGWCVCRYGKKEVSFTKNERGKLNAAIKQWVEVSATPAILRMKYAAYLRMFPKLPAPTPQAITNHWNALEESKRPHAEPYSPPPTPSLSERLSGLQYARDHLPPHLSRRIKP